MNQPEFSEQKLIERLRLEMSYADALHLLGQLCLALRHPKNVGSSAEVVRTIGATLANCVLMHFNDKLPAQVLDDWQAAGFLTRGDLN